jgi:hypothetical protein
MCVCVYIYIYTHNASYSIIYKFLNLTLQQPSNRQCHEIFKQVIIKEFTSCTSNKLDCSYLQQYTSILRITALIFTKRCS